MLSFASPAHLPAHPLPPSTRLCRVTLQVADLERSLRFYQGILGMVPLSQSPGRADLAAPGGEEVLIELREIPGTHPVPRRGALGLFHFALLLPSRAHLAHVFLHLRRAGIHLGASDHRVSEALYLSDPDGLGIEIYADRPRESWEYTSSGLRMDTTPLDVNSLLAEGEKESPHPGLPPGTTLGHLHLHVADLAEAERFFLQGVGFEVTVSDYAGALFFSAGGYHHHLGTNTWAGKDAPPASDRQARLLEWQLFIPGEVPAARAAFQLQKLGYPVTLEEGVYRIQDPSGTTLCMLPSL